MKLSKVRIAGILKNANKWMLNYSNYDNNCSRFGLEQDATTAVILYSIFSERFVYRLQLRDQHNNVKESRGSLCLISGYLVLGSNRSAQASSDSTCISIP